MTSLEELIDIFNNEIIHDQTKTLQERYWVIVELQTKLKDIFMYYYEYELLRLVLKDYNDILSEQLNFQRIKIFTPKTSIVDPNETENLVLNTVTQSSQKQQKALFGEVPINTSILQIPLSIIIQINRTKNNS